MNSYYRITNAYSRCGRIANPTERDMNSYYRITNAYIRCGRIANPTERVNTFEKEEHNG